MALTDILKAYMVNSVATDKAWRQFVLDHVDYIKENCITDTPTPEYMQAYQYDFTAYLLANNLSPEYHWIAYLINEFNSDVDFINPEYILIPQQFIITELYTAYRSVVNNYGG